MPWRSDGRRGSVKLTEKRGACSLMRIGDFFNQLSLKSFACIMGQSLSHRQIAGFCQKVGIEVPGYSLNKIPLAELICFIYEEGHKDSGILTRLEKLLDKVNQDLQRAFATLSQNRVKKDFKDWELLLNEGRLGAYLWAAWRDERLPVNREAKKICKHFQRALDMLRPLPEEEPAPLEEIPSLKQPEEELDDDIEAIIGSFYRFRRQWAEELKLVEKNVRKSLSEAKKAKGLAKKRLQEVRAGEARISELQKGWKDLKNRYQNLQKELSSRKKSEKVPLLQSRVYALERELRKKDYQIQKMEKEREKQSVLGDELEKTRLTLEMMRAEKVKVEEEQQELLEEAERLREKLRYVEESMKPAPPPKPPLPGKERLGIFVDMENIYLSMRATFFPGVRIDYDEMFARIARGRKVLQAIAYVVEADFMDKRAFFDMLKFKGFTVKRRRLKIRADRSMKGNWDMGMALDIIKYMENLDTIALVSGDGDFTDLVTFLKRKGLRVEVYGVERSTAMDLKREADLFIPIDSEWLLSSPG